ncbi:hypothetical protein QVD17_37936 [Tagetes erecta]|uniref:Uncharacterized protein n=1 Tax=Tagetes erecta TaxID=13708 RepID=A0AAD8JWW6_TARER|nr:hypothetical protein QVD17_37936 [Tagetes erecta]
MITSENSAVHQAGPNPGSYDLPSASQTEVLKQENADVAHGNQYNFPSSTPGSGYSLKQGAYTNSLQNALLAVNGHLVKESDLSYS